MYRAEIAKLNSFNAIDGLITLAITGAMSAIAYFFDGARIAAFGLLPVLGAWQYANQRGITRRTTPRLYWTLCLVATTVFCIASYWALSNPKQ